MTAPATSCVLKNRAGVVPLGRRSVRFASGDVKGVAIAQPRSRDVKIGARALPVNALR